MSATETSASARPPAWHPDPSGRHELRWWDGQAWTDRVADGGEIRREGEAQPEPEPEPEPASADPLGRSLRPRLTPEERPTTAPEPGPARSWTRLGLPLAGALIVLAAVFWGWNQRGVAAQWQDRANEYQAQVDANLSNNDALERSLNDAASGRARLEDATRQMAELQDATRMTVDQIYQCARTLDTLLAQYGSIDPLELINQADRSCGQAVANAEQLSAILQALTG
jgi:hypothetical protein